MSEADDVISTSVTATDHEILVKWVVDRLDGLGYPQTTWPDDKSRAALDDFVIGEGPKTLSIVKQVSNPGAVRLFCDKSDHDLGASNLLAYFNREGRSTLDKETIGNVVHYGTIGGENLNLGSLERVMKGLVDRTVSKNHTLTDKGSNELVGNFQQANSIQLSDGRIISDTNKQMDGLHVSKGPVLAPSMLRTEREADEDDDIVGNESILNENESKFHVKHASKITQRLLRDLAGECKEGKLRGLWRQILNPDSTLGLNPEDPDAKTGHEDMKDPDDPDEDPVFSTLSYLEQNPYHDAARMKQDETTSSGDTSIMPDINLSDNSVGRFDMINDPVDESCSQVLLPLCEKAYGGELGQWGNTDLEGSVMIDTSLNINKYGHTQGIIDKYSKARTIMKVCVSQLCILEHPYMSKEERLYIELKRIYAHYRAIFEHRTITYLCYRLCSLVKQMKLKQKQYVAKYGGGEEDSEGKPVGDGALTVIMDVSLLYKDFIETLPTLLQVQTALATLSNALYDTWKLLKSERESNGYTSTKALLIARELSGVGTLNSNSRNGSPSKSKASTPPRSRPSSPEPAPSDEEPLLKAGEDPIAMGDNASLAKDANAYNDELNVLSDFTSMLSDDIPSILKWVEDLLVEREREKLFAESAQEAPLPSDLDVRRYRSHVHKKEASPAEKLQAYKERMNEVHVEMESALNVLRKYKSSLGVHNNGGVMSESEEVSVSHKSAPKRGRKNSLSEKSRADLCFFPNVVFRLTNADSVTPSNKVPLVERRRRLSLACTEVTVRLRVNGEQLSQSATNCISYPSLAVAFNKTFELHVYHNPSDICLDVYLRLPTTWSGALLPSFLSSKLIATIGVPLPTTTPTASTDASGQGQGVGSGSTSKCATTGGKLTLAAAFAPNCGWLTFSSSERVNVPDITAEGMTFKAEPVFLEGGLYCTSEFNVLAETTKYPILAFEGPSRRDLAAIPSTTAIPKETPKSAVSLITSALSTSDTSTTALLAAAGSLSSNNHSNFDTSFAKESDFRRLMPELDELDMFDPRNAAIVSNIAHSAKINNGSKASRDYFRLYGEQCSTIFEEEGGVQGSGVGYNNFMRLAPSGRMKLLQLREYKPYLFTAPIPFSEKEIKESEVYRSLLNSIPQDKVPVNATLGSGHGAGGLGNTLTRGRLASGIAGEGSDSLSGTHARGLSDEFLDAHERDDMQQQVLMDSLSGNKDTQKVIGFLERVRDVHASLEKGKGGSKQQPLISTGNVVAETDYGFEFEFFQIEKLIPERVRSLKPKPKSRMPQALQVDHCNVLVQVVGCRNVPLRVKKNENQTANLITNPNSGKFSGTSTMDRSGTGFLGSATPFQPGSNRADRASFAPPTISDNKDLLVDSIDDNKRQERMRACTFVEVSFQEHTVRTTNCLEGNNPLWKQSLRLPFHPPQNDFTPSRLQQVREDVHFALFDEVYENEVDKGGHMEGEKTVRVERRFLGSFSIPFATIYQEGRIEGVFRLRTPVFNIGYEYHNQGRNTGPSTSLPVGVEPNQPSVIEACLNSTCQMLGVNTPFGLLINNATGGMCEGLCTSGANLEVDEHGNPRPGGLSDLRDTGVYMHTSTKQEFDYYASDNDGTYIKLMLTLDPLLVTPPSAATGGAPGDDAAISFDSSKLANEDMYLGTYAANWLSEIQSHSLLTRHRRYSVFASGSSGKQTLICRYICPLKPPSCLNITTRRGVLHLVSMLPFLPDTQVALGDIDLWCTAKQTWDMCCGDEEEHAILVCNYLTYLATHNHSGTLTSDNRADLIEIYIVLGKAVPEGANTVYVLLRDKNKSNKSVPPTSCEAFLLINPCDGFVYSAADPNCPLQHIHTLITSDNIYGNIQLHTKPCKLTYDITTNPSNWRPFFGNRMEFPKTGLSSVQVPVEYVPTNPYYALDIEKAVLQAIKTSMRRWRSRRKSFATTFHPDVCATAHDVLPMLEEWKKTGGIDVEGSNSVSMRSTTSDNAMDQIQAIIRNRCKTLLKTRQLKGYPMNLPFSDVDAVLEQIKAVGIHEIKATDVQFVLAVRAFPLVNNAISLWVFVGSLEVNHSK